ncbi:MAG: methionine biosynthesis protein MetW [Rhodospirillaceae bacterium]|jgi:methionine biosynthesis protein MetW|nr:methionine biosynthesis protein MetW [Rhodospirillaceae bacterium]MBT5666342.1 methionine biosynthesis protein MetW [Rhodospirillaceae bacterium]
MNVLKSNGRSSPIRIDLKLIADMIEPGSRVLDVGCGEGELLAYLAETKQTDGRGVELSMSGVSKSVRSGLSVIQGDADTDLKDYPTGAFDYVVLSQTLQATYRPREVVENLVRISRRAIVSFPNFAYWRVRLGLMFTGKMPVTDTLTHTWYDTPNIHHCTVKDFVETCRDSGIAIEQAIPLTRGGNTMTLPATGRLANLLAEQAMFVLRRPD